MYSLVDIKASNYKIIQDYHNIGEAKQGTHTDVLIHETVCINIYSIIMLNNWFTPELR